MSNKFRSNLMKKRKQILLKTVCGLGLLALTISVFFCDILETNDRFIIKNNNSHIPVAGHLSAEQKTIGLGNGARMELVLIPAGSFFMGSQSIDKDRFNDEGPVRQVQITKPFYMSKYEVTQEQYMVVIGENPSYYRGKNLPVESVSWNDAMTFCEKIGSGFRLPTEAEWEYACKAGSDTHFDYNDSPKYLPLCDFAWYIDNSGYRTHCVGRKKPNSFGLYDMHGNVWEWCSDWYADNYQKASDKDPRGPSFGSMRILRGGAWSRFARYCRSTHRYRNAPDFHNSDHGFRVVLDLE